MAEAVNHPPHYGGADNPYEAIKVIEAWGLGLSPQVVECGTVVERGTRVQKSTS